MAEVFLALQEGLGGFEKLVVVKRIFPHFCEDEQFVRMFFDEARLAASIRHPNCVEIFDVTQDEDGFFIVMEYLSGETLSYILDELRDDDARIPLEIVCRIGADIAAGLHHAHANTDDDGQLQPIIHRDVTPSNIIICYSGVTKLVDFGVAKAAARDQEDSRPGTVKGKLAYLAPEQLDEGTVDARTDVFQLGVCLHEMLTGERLFKGTGDRGIMNAVMEQEIPPPSSIVELPEEIDAVVLGALQRDRDKRTASADLLRRQLTAVLQETTGNISGHDVADWMQSRFESRYNERRDLERAAMKQMRAGKPSSEMPAMSAPFDDTAPVGAGAAEDALATVAERPSARMPAVTPPPVRRHRGLVAAAAVLGLALVAGAVVWGTGMASGPDEAGAAEEGDEVARAELGDPGGVGAGPGAADEATLTAPATPPADSAAAADLVEPEPSTFVVSLTTAPPDAAIALDGERVGTGQLETELPRDGQSHRLYVTAPGHEPVTIWFRDAPPPPEIQLAERASPPRWRGPGPSRGGVADVRGHDPVQSDPVEAGSAGGGDDDRERGRHRPTTDNLDPWKR